MPHTHQHYLKVWISILSSFIHSTQHSRSALSGIRFNITGAGFSSTERCSTFLHHCSLKGQLYLVSSAFALVIMANIVTICACVLLSVMITYFARLPGVDGVPADVQFSNDRAATQTTTLFPNSHERIPNSGKLQSLQKKVQTTTFQNGTTSSNASFTTEPAGFFPTSSSIDFDPFIISEAPDFAVEDTGFAVNSTTPTAGISWIYYMVCGSSTSMTMGDKDLWTTQGLSSSNGPIFSSNIIVNPGDDQGQNGLPPSSTLSSSSSSGPLVRRTTIETSKSPGTSNSNIILTVSSSDRASTVKGTVTSAPTPGLSRRDSGDSPCSYMKCSGTSCQPFTGPSSSSSSTLSTMAAPTSTLSTTAAPTFSCVYQDATPENPAMCSCVSGLSSISVAPLSMSSVSVITQSCDYTAWPSTQPTVTSPPATISTNFAGISIAFPLIELSC